MNKTQIINPISYTNWNNLLLLNEEYSFFQSSQWARVLYESYHYKPLYFSSFNEERLLASIPLVEIKSSLTGKRGVSLPFSDYCEPIIYKKDQFRNVFNSLITHGKNTCWKFVEFRGGGNVFYEFPYYSYYYGHNLELIQDEDQIFSNFRSSTKRNINKAIKKGLEVNISNSYESLKKFYRLNCITRKRLGLPPQPYYFLKKYMN